MSRKNTFLIALLLAVAAIVGVVALARTARVGAPAHAQTVSKISVERRARALDRLERSLQIALTKKPPKLPAIPAAPAAPVSAPQVTYVRPAPIVIHRSAGGGEREREGSGEAEGGGLDD